MDYGRRSIPVGLVLGITLLGCSPESPATFDQAAPSGSVVVDLSALRRAPGENAQQTCASLAAEVVLRVEDERNGPEEFRRAVAAQSGIVRFDGIEVQQGMVRFSAEVLSENQSVLYAGEISQRIETETFQAELITTARAPVLQVCPGEISLGRGDESSETVQIRNRGLGTLTYQAVSPDCDQIPCVRFEGPSGSLPRGESADLVAILDRIFPVTSLDLTVQSPQGSVAVAMTLGQFPDLMVRSLELTGPLDRNGQGDFIQPVRVVIRNVGNVAADVFKVAAEYTNEAGGTFVTPFQVPGQQDLFYAFTGAPVQPGEEVTLEGVVVFASFLNGSDLLLRLESDSCSGDEFQEPFCRVDEFDEGNNFSEDVSVSLPWIDLIPVPDATGSFCRVRAGVVTVRNQGTAPAGPSTTVVDFVTHGTVNVPTPALPAGTSTDLLVPIPPGTFDDFEFRITVDALNQVSERNEGNNTASGSCIG